MPIITSLRTGNWRADDVDTWGLGDDTYPAAGNHVIIDTGHTVTLGESNDAGSLRVNGTLAGNHTITLNDGGNSAILHNDGTINNTPNFTITGGTNREIKNDGSSTLGTITINSSGQTFSLAGPNIHTWEALTITAGTLTTNDGSDRNLTVTGACVVAGTLTGNASAITLGSLEIAGGTYNGTSGTTLINGAAPGAYTWKNSSGTFNHNGGTVDIRFTGTDGVHLKESTFYNYTQTLITGTHPSARVNWRPSTGTVLTVLNDMTIEEGYFRPNTASHSLDVLGDCVIVTPSVASALGYAASTYTGNWRFGSLTVQTGAQYLATGGTTTITGGLRPGDIAGTFDLQPGTQRGAVELGGTGGNFEGDFLKDAREVRIKQDPVLNFDGVDDIITIADSASLDLSSGDVLTLSAWTYWDANSFNTDRKILAKGHVGAGTNDYSAYQLRSHDSTGRLYLSIYNGSWDEAYTDPGFLNETDTWVHIAVTLASDNVVNFYKNGVLHTAHTISHAIPANSGPLLIGARGDSTGDNAKDYFDGKIADVRIYDSALAVADIQKLASKMFIGVGSPVGWWKLNDGTTSVVDSSINTNTGTISGATWTHNDFGVDIQAPETTGGATVAATTVQNLIVESGQLNTKALTTYHFTDTGGSNLFTDDRPHTHDLSVKPITIAGWVRPDTSIAMQVAGLTGANNDGKYSLGFGFDENRADAMGLGITFSSTETPSYNTTIKNCGVDASALISLDEWVHLAMTYNGGGFTTVGNYDFYVNGVLVTTSKAVATDVDIYRITPSFGGNKVAIGKGGNPMKGDQRDIRIYDYALSADQIASLYRGSFNITPNVAWYKLDEGTGDPADSSTAALGTVSYAAHAGGTWTTTGSLKVNGAARVLDNGSVL